MGTLFEITVTGADTSGYSEYVDRAFFEVSRIESLMTDYDTAGIPANVVGRLNATGSAAGVDSELVQILQRAEELTHRCHGAFDITTGTITSLWRNAEDSGVVPSSERIADAVRCVGINCVSVDTATSAVSLVSGTRIDLGGIAKGYAVDRALGILKAAGVEGALVNGGGDMAAFGVSPRGTPWRIGIRHPRKSARDYFAVVTLENRAVATSGDYERGYVFDDMTFGHIIDPRTGSPADCAVSATVIAPTAELADALSTAVFVLGADSGRVLLESIPDVEGIIMENRAGQLAGVTTTGLSSVMPVDTSGIRIRSAGAEHSR